MTYGKTITIEDLEIQIPQSETQGTKSKFHRSIRGGRLPYFVEKTSTYSWQFCSQELLIKFEELASNPFFSSIPIYNLDDRINHGFIKSWSRNWKFAADDVSMDLVKGYGKFMFLPETVERPIHDRWNYLIQEWFDSSGVWGYIADVPASPFNSTGYGKQIQTIPWEEITGDWETADAGTYQLVGDQYLRQGAAATSSRIVAGWEFWSDYEVSAWVFLDDAVTDNVGIIGRWIDSNNYFLFFTTDDSGVYLNRYKDGSATQWYSTDFNIALHTWYHFKIVFEGRRVRTYINGKEIFDILTEEITSGRVGCYCNDTGCYFDDLRVTTTFPKNYNLPASVDWHEQYFHAKIPTAYGIQRKLISVDENVQFKQSKAGEDCILYLPMNEGVGDPQDHSKRENSVTTTGGTWAIDKEKGWVLEWNGVIGEQVLVDMPDNSPTKYTIDFEVRADVFQYSYAVCFTGLDPLWYIGGTPTSWSWYFTGNARYDNLAANMSIDTWYRISMIIDSDNDWVDCFVDGELLGRITHADINDLGDAAVAIGSNITAGTQPWTGAIRQLRVFDAPRWDVAYGFDATPATVFVWDDNRYDANVDYPKDDECVLLLHMDEGNGTITYDASGRGHDATLVNTPTWINTSFRGEAGTCLEFTDVGNEYLNIADHADFSFGDASDDSPFTFEAWIYLDLLTTNPILDKVGAGPGAFEYWLFIDLNGYVNIILFDDSTGGSIGAVSTTALSLDNWYHIAVTYDGLSVWTGLNIYVNGVLQAVGSDNSGSYTAMEPLAADLRVGRQEFLGNEFDGKIDEVRIHSQELSAEEIAARFGSEPYLHNHYLMDRVYSKIHKFKGLPVISNGLIKLAFPDYDTNEFRATDILMPTIYAWYEDSWHELGFISPYVQYSAETKALNQFQSSEWEIEELTDQYCKMRITYVDAGDSPQWPQDYKVEMRFIIRNGYPGVIIEPIGTYQDDAASDRHGFLFIKYHLYGQGMPSRWVYMPEENFYDKTEASHISLTTSAIDDNWFLKFEDNDIYAPSKNVIVGGFSDSMLDDYGAGTQWYVADSDGYYIYYLHQTTYGGIFFIPYDYDNLFRYANSDYADVTTDGQNNQGCGSAGLGCILIGNGTAGEYAQWNVGILPKGRYMYIARAKSYNGSAADRECQLFVDNDADHDGDLASSGTVVCTPPSDFINLYLPFYANGTDDIWVSIENIDATDDIYVDGFVVIPISNSVDYPVDLAHQAFNETKPIRGLKK